MKAELESLVDQMIMRGILFDEAVKEFEKKFILNVLDRNNNNLSKAADELGIHRNTLSKKVGEYQNGSNGHNSVNGNGHHSGVSKSSKRKPATRRKRAEAKLKPSV